MEYQVIHQPQRSRFEVTLDNVTAYVEYVSVSHNHIRIIHTIVPSQIEGRGVAAALVKVALEYARTNKIEVSSTCSYASLYMQRHPELL